MLLKRFILIINVISLFTLNALAVTKTSTGSTNWGNNSTWSPLGVPTASDDIIIASNHNVTLNVNSTSCKTLLINSTGSLNITNGKTLTIANTLGLNVNGTLNISLGNITLANNNTSFTIGSGGSVIWNPGNNTLAAASLFTKGTENFSATSSLTIEKWYDYTVPLKNVISGNFGNLTFKNLANTYQLQNTLQTNQVVGTLTVEGCSLVLDNTNSISNTTIGNIVLKNGTSYLNFYNGSHNSGFTVNVSNITIAGGELNALYALGTGNCILNVSGDIIMTSSAIFKGANGHNGNFTLNVSGNLSLTRGYFYGVINGNGNSAIDIAGNLTLLKSGSNYSEFYNIVDGNGNAQLTIDGDFSNQGYFDLIWNTGVTGVGNGNAKMTIGGTFYQSDGDFRGIWNLTTTNSGNCAITMNTINFTGGIFMVHYGINTTTIGNSLNVINNFSVTFGSSADIFRGNGLTNISSSNNAATFTMTVGGITTIAGNASAEFSLNTSYGTETINTKGAFTVSGGSIKVQAVNHTTIWNHSSNFSIKGGIFHSGFDSGSSTINISGDIDISSGTITMKNNTGLSTINLSGNFIQSGGITNLYGNTSIISSENLNFNVAGDFIHSGGIINFSSNAIHSGAINLNLTGDDYTLSGTGTITSAGAGSSTKFGNINFNRAGTTTYNRSGSHDVQQIKQKVSNGNTLNVSTGNLQIASSSTVGTDFLTITNGAVLNLNTNSIISNAKATHSGLNIASGGTLKTANINGLYNNSTTASISNAGNMNFALDANSIIEYNGTDDQVISGTGIGNATGNQHKYGILKINFAGTENKEKTYLNSSNTFVRTELQLTSGELYLNEFTLNIESGNSNAITRNNGYIKSETNASVNNSIVKWNNLTSGDHTIPFGVNSTSYIPVTFTPTGGIGGNLEVSTRATGADNTPLTCASHVSNIANLNRQGIDFASSNVIDRWWVIRADGMTAGLSLTYLGNENTTTSAIASGKFNPQIWDGTKWTTPLGNGSGTTSGTGTITALGAKNFGPIVLVGASGALQNKLVKFEAKLIENIVKINWTTESEKENELFSIERSKDGKQFEVIENMPGAGTSSFVRNYATIDTKPYDGRSYYRIKHTDFEGKRTYSEVRQISRGVSSEIASGIVFKSVGPNPFNNQFMVNYSLPIEGIVEIQLYNTIGQMIFKTTKKDAAGSNNFEFIDENNLPPGNYILNVINGTQKFSKKIVKAVN